MLQAYGWQDLGPVPWSDDDARQAWTENLLVRLVALNARRTADEAHGLIRWLRPEFQDPARRSMGPGTVAAASTPTARQVSLESSSDADEGQGASAGHVSLAVTTRRPWPPELPEQMRITAEVLGASPIALSADELAEHFKGKGPWKKRLPQILETLEAVGRAIKVAGEGTARWAGA